MIDRIVKHLGVGMEAHLRAVPVGFADDLHLLRNVAAGEFHLVDAAVFEYAHLQPVRECVYHARADAVQTAGDLIAPAAELAAGVQHRIDDLERGLARLLLNVHGNAAAVVGHADGLAVLNGYLDMRAEARERLVDGVIDDLIYQMVQTA